jgi:hypothetical protein
MVKLRLAVRSLARQHVESMDVAEVTYKGADHLRHIFNITHEPGKLPHVRARRALQRAAVACCCSVLL